MKGDGFCEAWGKRARESEVGRYMVDDLQWRCKEQGYVFQICDTLRRIVNGCIEEEEVDAIIAWWKEVENNLISLGVEESCR